MGTVLHRRPSDSFATAAVTSSSLGERPIPIQPVRQPGARYAFDMLENEMIAASGSRLPIEGTGPSYPRSPYTSSARTTRPRSSAIWRMARLVSVEYDAPVGLFGSMTTIARV